METEKLFGTGRMEGSKALKEDLADLKRVLPMALITQIAVNNHFLVYKAILAWRRTTKRTTRLK